jgi:hypothetical protein
MKQGHNYQYANGNDKFYNMDLSYYMDKKEQWEDKDAYEAQYLLMKLIYNNMFLPDFTNNDTLFKDAVNKVKKINKEQNEKQNNKFAQAFEGIRYFRDNDNKQESINDYLSYIQSYLVTKDNDNKKKGINDEEAKNNFSNFILQIFIKGFDSFLEAKKWELTPKLKLIVTDTKKEKAEKRKELKEKIINDSWSKTIIEIEIKQEDTDIAFYTFCKLLDNSHLSTLRNEFKKYESATGGEVENKIKKIKEILSIIELCLLSADRVKQKTEYVDEKELECYVEDYSKWEEDKIYTQEDDFTKVVHKNIEIVHHYGTENLLKKLIKNNSNFKITKKEHDEWNKLKNNIEEKTKKREKFHGEWVKNKANFSQEKEYQKLCIYIDRYNYLDNKLHFQHFRQLHNLTIEILSRIIGFIALWDRDLKYYDKHHDKLITTSEIPYDKIRKYHEFLSDEKINGEYLYEKTRNYIAHLNYLTIQNSEKTLQFSLIELINYIRKMFCYDRKLKNAVTKAMIKIFDRNGMILKFKTADYHKFVVESIEPKKVYHLGTKEKDKNVITTNQVSKEYCDMCKALLNLK